MAEVEVLLDVNWLRPYDWADGHLAPGPNVLRYGRGMDVAIEIVTGDWSNDEGEVDAILDAVAQVQRPGRWALVVGDLAVSVRAALSQLGVAWLDRSGAFDFPWPGVQKRRRPPAMGGGAYRPLSIRGAAGLVVQELLQASFHGDGPSTVSGLAAAIDVPLSRVSRTVSELADAGLVEKDREGRGVHVRVSDPRALAELLAERTSVAMQRPFPCFRWGRDVTEVVERLANDVLSGVGLAVTGPSGAAEHGVLMTGISSVHVRVRLPHDELADAARHLRMERVPLSDANVLLYADRPGLGLWRARPRGDGGLYVANPLRVWADLRGLPRGEDLAEQLWPVMAETA